MALFLGINIDATFECIQANKTKRLIPFQEKRFFRIFSYFVVNWK